MKSNSRLFAIVGLLVTSFLLPLSPSAHAVEDWKGESDSTQISFGGLTGMGIVDSTLGFTVLGTISKKLIKRGFVSDLNNSVSIEGLLGPVFLPATTGVIYSVHLRWDFVKDSEWTLYAVGGAGGDYYSIAGSGRFTLVPRFGIGALWRLQQGFAIRGEISHNLIVAGVNFSI